MILSGSAVHVNGLGSWFVSATKRLMVAWRSTTHRKTPRFSAGAGPAIDAPLDACGQRSCRGSRAHFFGRHLRVNGVQEADELLMTMALHTSANDLAFEDIESSEHRRCAMALV